MHFSLAVSLLCFFENDYLTGLMGVGRLEKIIEKKTEIERKSTKVRVNTSTHCHQRSHPAACNYREGWEKETDKKGFNETLLE